MAGFNFVGPSILTESRLDSAYYSTRFLENEERLSGCGIPRKTIAELSELCNCGATPQGVDYGETGVGLIRTSDVRPNQFFAKEVLRTEDLDPHSLRESVKARTGDLLYTMSGTIGYACVIPSTNEVFSFSNTIARVRLPDESANDVHFISTFFNCFYGYQQSLRLTSGGIQGHVMPKPFKDLLIPTPDPVCQRYIGDKVRQADALMAWSENLEAQVDSVIDSIGFPSATVPAMVNSVAASRLANRLDPRPYRTHFIELVREIESRKHDVLSRIAKLSSGYAVSSSDFITNGDIPLIRIRNIDKEGFLGLDIGVPHQIFSDGIKCQARPGWIVLGMDGEFRAQFFLEEDLPMLVNQRVAIIKAIDIRPELLTHWLNRQEGQLQLNQWAVRTTVEHTSLSDIGRLRIPRMGREHEDALADMLRYSRLSRHYSRKLSALSRLILEGIIEGKISESLLVEAQRSLDIRDSSPDRALLSRMKIDGVEGKGNRLFPEPDRLYELLEQANQELEA